MDEPANDEVRLEATFGSRRDLLLRQGRYDEPVGHVNAERTAAALPVQWGCRRVKSPHFVSRGDAFPDMPT